MTPTPPTAAAARRREAAFARVYDEEIHPLVNERLGDLMLRAAVLQPASANLEIGCTSGALTAELAHKLDHDSRIVAADGSTALLDLARQRLGAEHAGRHVTFRVRAADKPLPFAGDSFDTVLANLPLSDLPTPAAVLADVAHVTKPGGQVVVGTLLRGSWAEPLEILAEVLARQTRKPAQAALAAYLERWPRGETVARSMEAAGLRKVSVELDRWEILFRSAREFFFAPVIEYGPLPTWKDLVGRGAAMHDIFLAMKEAIDTYFVGRPFSVSIFAGRFSAHKPASTSTRR